MTAHDEDAVDLARQIERPLPSAARIEEARTALLAAASLAEPRPRGSRVWFGGAVLAAAAAVLLVAVRPNTVTPHHHGDVLAREHTAFVRFSSMPDEIVMLYDGTIDVDVESLHAHERFRVLVGADEVEVHGTAFAVTARAGKLADVVVTHGVVEVRAGTERRTLTVGQSWGTRFTASAEPAPLSLPASPPAASGPPPASPAPRPEGQRRAVEATHSVQAEQNAVEGAGRANVQVDQNATLQVDQAAQKANADGVAPAVEVPPKPARIPEEIAYDDGWAAMRAERFREAAAAFARVLLLSPTGPLAEDAGFWYAVALARSGQPLLAGTAFGAFVDGFPASRRLGEASAMLGWILLEAGNRREASRRFHAASSDPDPTVRASARAGLEATNPSPSK